MNSTQSLAGYSTTKRFKPSAQLIQLTKRRMDEAEQLLKRLEQRESQTASTAEKRAIQAKIIDIKKQYAGFIQEMQVHAESQNQQTLPREPTHSQAYQPTFSEEKHDVELNRSAYMPSSNTEKKMYVPPEAVMCEETLNRKLALGNTMTASMSSSQKLNWKQMQLDKIKQLDEMEKIAQQERDTRERMFKDSLVDEINDRDYVKNNKVATHKVRPVSPKIFHDGSCMSKIGHNDYKRQCEAARLKNELNCTMSEQTCDDDVRHKMEREMNRKEKQIDLSTGVLPADRYENNGKIKTCIIPDKYREGKTFDNESLIAPERPSCLDTHNITSQFDKKVMNENDRIAQIRIDRDEGVVRSRNEKISEYSHATDLALTKRAEIMGENKTKRFGSIRCDEDPEINFGHVYGSINRRVFPQNDPKTDVVYTKDNFISRIDEGDRARRGKKSYVLPLTEDEKATQEFKEFMKKHPNQRPLEDWEVSMIRGYIEEKKAVIKRYWEMKQNQEKYGAELAAFEAEVKSRDENLLDERETAMNVPPRFVKPLF
ncbi:V-SNARE N-terminal domain-containing protein [Spironucleus salmonicida]|uniref:V-SNARE N-terminal domain-containing protein n=1 Tax=Spironucleus salmonicida TaxID=348837 RepID=V6LYS6_9EUKA|nr:V-SNARE N-terminal domain-containing protein [Spironucleus salmonicida]|eukprot:EST45979.1 V-SNARE N-terminal domain-containing protein [Spironucleus salmonicida]